MDMILWSVKWQFAIVYVYKIVSFSKNQQQNLNHVWKVFLLLPRAGDILKLEKNNIFTDTMDYLLHILCPTRLEFASEKGYTISEPQKLTSATEPRLCFWLMQRLHRVVFNFAQIVAPLNQRLKNAQLAFFTSVDRNSLRAIETLKTHSSLRRS